MHRLLARVITSALLSLCALAHAFPDKPITLVVPFPAGGTTDVIGRLIAHGLSARLAQPVVVDNRAGAGGAIGAAAVAQARADGYTLLISSNTTFTVNPALRERLPYDPVRSFEGVGLIGTSPLVLLAHPALPAATLQEFVILARAQPGRFSYGSFGAGTVSHLAGELLKLAADVDLVHVPYKGGAPAMADLIGGHIQLSVDTPLAALPHLRNGKVRALAVTSPTRLASLPQVPTVAESGYPAFDFVTWTAVVAPRGLPEPVRQALTQALADTLADPKLQAELSKSGLDVRHEPGAAYDTRVARELPQLRASAHKGRIQAD